MGVALMATKTTKKSNNSKLRLVTTSLGIPFFSSEVLADNFFVSKPRLNTKVKNILAAENTKITLVFVKSID
ncbi:hypothetical protein D3C86_1684770 [compost metagenome]